VIISGGLAVWATQRLVTGKTLIPRKPRIHVIQPPNDEKRAEIQRAKAEKSAAMRHLKQFETPNLTPEQRAQLEKAKEEVRRGTPYRGPVMAKSK